MNRVFNFSAGPSMLPIEVLEAIQQELLDYDNHGFSVLELNHRTQVFYDLLDSAELRLRSLMEIPNNYRVLFLSGGTSLHFAMIPMNFSNGKRVGYIDSSVWAQKAIAEAKKIADVVVVGSSKDTNYNQPPVMQDIPEDLAYVHITSNATSEGTMVRELPNTHGVPLIADMCSNIMSFPYKVSDFGMIYAGVQKNLGAAGLTLCIIREDLLKDSTTIPSIFHYKTLIDAKNVFNTPNVFGVYVLNKMLKWVDDQGGVSEMFRRNEEKASLIYQYIDHSDYYKCLVNRNIRSNVNVTFTTGNDALDNFFSTEAEAQGLVNTHGHASRGGIRVSMYNAMPIEGVKALIDFMKRFKDNHPL